MSLSRLRDAAGVGDVVTSSDEMGCYAPGDEDETNYAAHPHSAGSELLDEDENGERGDPDRVHYPADEEQRTTSSRLLPCDLVLASTIKFAWAVNQPRPALSPCVIADSMFHGEIYI